jgi:hypothetical protein
LFDIHNALLEISRIIPAVMQRKMPGVVCGLESFVLKYIEIEIVAAFCYRRGQHRRGHRFGWPFSRKYFADSLYGCGNAGAEFVCESG